MKIIKIENEIFWFTTEVVLCANDKEFDSYSKKAHVKLSMEELPTSETHNWYYVNYKWQWIIVMRKLLLDTMTHELIHLVFRLLDDRWVPTRVENDEVFAYTVWYYVRKIVEWFKIKVTTS